MNNNNTLGILFGAAYGDALAAPVEFVRSVHEIHLAEGLPGNPARVTDDTQLMLAVGEALVRAQGDYRPAVLEKHLCNTFVGWLISPENNRAPGMTCLSACQRLKDGLPWLEATVHGSKGCGANMRVQPVGLLDVESETRAAVAQLQAALTHGHPTALAASDLTAFALWDLGNGGAPATLVKRLITYAQSQREVYHYRWLGALWQRGGASPESFIARGWDECLDVLSRLEIALWNPNLWRKSDADPCQATGEGWIAEEALATGLLCFLLFPDAPVQAIRRAARTSGDSDSLACLTGAFAGAHCGFAAWPAAWQEQIEYTNELQALSTCLMSTSPRWLHHRPPSASEEGLGASGGRLAEGP